MRTLITGTSYGPANELLNITANGYLGAWGRRDAQLQFVEAVDTVRFGRG